ncbi:MAG: AAA family ATPase [Burkholderiales bacterium]
MLFEFSVSNFRSILTRQALSLVASGDSTHAQGNTAPTESKDLRLLRSAVIYGPNAAGKSNLLKGLQALQWLVQNSSSGLQEGQRLPVAPFMLSTASRSEPTAFEIMFAVGGTRFHYGVELTTERVTKEWLVAYPLGRPQRWFEREFKRENGGTTWWFGPNFKGESKQRQVWQNSTRSNALFLSTAVQLNNEQLRPVFDWIVHKLIVLALGIDFNPFLSLEMLKLEETRQRLMQFISAAGVEIDRLELREEEGLASVVPLVANVPGLVIPPQAAVAQKVLRVVAWHKASDGSDDVAFDLSEESDGTRKLFEFAGGWLRALDSGATLFVDELDRSLHPKLTHYLVQLFNSKTNRNNAQLVFTTHDTTLLDPDLLRRDQVWFVEKNPQRASHLYSLLEFSPRKDEGLERGYLKGRYGAIPLIGRWDW